MKNKITLLYLTALQTLFKLYKQQLHTNEKMSLYNNTYITFYCITNTPLESAQEYEMLEGLKRLEIKDENK